LFCVIPGSFEMELDNAVKQYLSCAFADNTKKAYKTHRNSYINFCTRFGYSAVPASSTTLCRYAAYLAQKLKFGSIKQYLNIVRILHAEWGLPNPILNDFALNCTLKGIRRCLGDTVNRKQPITPILLRKLLSKLNLKASLDATVWAVSLCMFFGLLRKSNVMPDNFLTEKHLRRRDVKFFAWGVSLCLRWSKVNQFQERSFDVPLARKPQNPLCPVQAIFNSFSLTKNANLDGPAFVFMSKGQLKALSSKLFLTRVHSCLKQAGINTDQISNHSYRRGGATFCYQLGFSADNIKLLGDWRSNCYLKYIDGNFRSRLKLTNAMLASV